MIFPQWIKQGTHFITCAPRSDFRHRLAERFAAPKLRFWASKADRPQRTRQPLLQWCEGDTSGCRPLEVIPWTAWTPSSCTDHQPANLGSQSCNANFLWNMSRDKEQIGPWSTWRKSLLPETHAFWGVQWNDGVNLLWGCSLRIKSLRQCIVSHVEGGVCCGILAYCCIQSSQISKVMSGPEGLRHKISGT